MKTLHGVLIILLLFIIIITTSMMAYKIETFTNLVDKNVYPQTPNDYTCYNYIKNVKQWNIDELTNDQKKVLFTMRTLQGEQFADNSNIFPYQNGCVIPIEHFPIFNIPSNSTSFSFTPIIKDDNGIQTGVKADITLQLTDSTYSYPHGLLIDFNTMEYNQFKDLLNGAYKLYDAEFLQSQKDIENQIEQENNTYNANTDRLNNLIAQTENTNKLTIQLKDKNSECQKTIANNINILAPNISDLNNKNNNILNINNQLQEYINDGNKQIDKLKKCNIGATVYQDCNYGGYAVKLSAGRYVLSQLLAKGALNDDISSVRVQPNTRVTLYEHDSFQGRALQLTSDTLCLVDYGFNDITSSIIIESTI